MVLTGEERMLIQISWAILDPGLDLGEEVLTRLFQVYMQSKIYFPHSNDGAIMNMNNIRMDNSLANVSDLHAYNLRLDPINFKFLTRGMHVTLASSLRGDYNALGP